MTAVAQASWRKWVVKVDSRGRITLPAEVRQLLGVRPGDTLVIVDDGHGLRIEAAKSMQMEQRE